MNTRMIFWASVAIVSLFVCVKTPLLPIIFSLLIMGTMPGTSLVVPAWIMLLVYPLLFIGAIAWLTHQSLFIGVPQATKPNRTKAIASKKRAVRAKNTGQQYKTAKGQKA